MMHGAAKWCWLALASCVMPLQAAEPRYIGRSSCGTATCHGGLTDRGLASHSSDSLWRSQDPHLLAGNVLLNPLSRRIVTALEPRSAQSATEFDTVLLQRCVSCHAPAAVAKVTLADASASATRESSPADNSDHSAEASPAWRKRLADGVSCEACHGAASEWLVAHTLTSWDEKGSGRFAPEFGMKDTESLASRTENCAGCHVGSRSRDGLVRDMNHDMIAAGHPALHFDMWQAQHRLPPHWDQTREKLASAPSESAAAIYLELRQHVITAATQLSEERMAYSRDVLQIQDFEPELSEFECAACHHRLTINSPRLVRGSKGKALWQPWYTAGLMAPAMRSQLNISAPDFATQLQAMKGQLTTIQGDAVAPSADALVRIRQLIASYPLESAADYSSLPVWFDELDALLPKASRLPTGARDQLKQVVIESRQRLLPVRKDCPLPLQRLMPTPWNKQQAEQTRQQLQELIARTASGAQQ